MHFLIKGIAASALLASLAYFEFGKTQPQTATAQLDNRSRPRLAAADLSTAPSTGEGRYDLRSRKILTQVILLIKESYVDPARIKPYEMLLAALDYVEKTVPEILVDEAGAPHRVRIAVGTAEREFDLTINYPWEIGYKLRDVFEFIQDNINPEQDLKDIEYAAVNGMLSTLDPHSILLKPENFEDMKMATKGEFGGLGISIAIRDGALTIISPMDGTPASRAGLRALDKIVQIGEESTINMGIDEAVQRLRGKAGTKVQISVLRSGWTESKKFTLTRAIIKIESVTSELLSGGVGYIKIKSFQQNTFDDLYSHLGKLKQKTQNKLKGLVLDLRNNPGGLLDQAILISDLFIAHGPLVITVGEGNKKREEKDATAAGTETELPLVTLINGGSASASEIVSGALKNHNRSVVVGQQSFGKGSVQVLYDFKDQSALKLTIAQYLTPGDISIQSVGITPDVLLYPGLIDKSGINFFSHAELTREKDLDKHLDRQNQNTGLTDAPPTETITYLLDKKPDEPQESEAEDQSVDPNKFVEDFEIKFAKEVLARAVTADRRRMLENAAPFFKKQEKEVEDKISKAMSAVGVDWTAGKPLKADTQQLEVAIEFTTPSSPSGGVASKSNRVKAGDEITIRGTVRNTGSEPLHRVYGITTSDNPMFDKREFVFGKIDPGQTRTWQMPLKIPKDTYARVDEVKLKLEGISSAQGTGRAVVTIDELARPHFSYRWQLKDDKAPGNGDGVLDAGEDVEMHVLVRNQGNGAAQDAYVTLKNMAGENIYIEQGRAKLGTLAPNEEKAVVLKFAAKHAGDKPAELKLGVVDFALGEQLSEKLTFDLNASKHPARAEAKKPFFKINADNTRVLAAAAAKVDTLAEAKTASVFKATGLYKTEQGEFVSVSWGENRFGFVPANSGEWVASDKGPKKVSDVFAHSSPDIKIMDGVRGTRTATSTVALKGHATSTRPMRDVFIFVNDQKVFFKSAAQASQDEGVFKQPFDVQLPLKVGTNTVKVFAREDEDTAAVQTFVLFREGEASVAQVSPEANPLRRTTH